MIRSGTTADGSSSGSEGDSLRFLDAESVGAFSFLADEGALGPVPTRSFLA